MTTRGLDEYSEFTVEAAPILDSLDPVVFGEAWVPGGCSKEQFWRRESLHILMYELFEADKLNAPAAFRVAMSILRNRQVL
jgi:hypothetical protein